MENVSFMNKKPLFTKIGQKHYFELETNEQAETIFHDGS